MPKAKRKIDWKSAPQAARKRKKVQLTLGDEARAELARRGAEHERGQSGVVEDLLVPRNEVTGMTGKS